MNAQAHRLGGAAAGGGVASLQYAATPGEQLMRTLEILFWLALVALLKGLAAGYVSHLALDALTPRGIPII